MTSSPGASSSEGRNSPALSSATETGNVAADKQGRVGALIFDLDGLLVDSEPLWFEVEGAYLARWGHTWTKQEALRCMGQGTPSTLRIWQAKYGIDVDIERDTSAIIDTMIARANDMVLMKGATALLEQAAEQRVPMAVASSSPRRLIEAVLRAKEVRDYFTAIASGQEVARSKPAPDVFLKAAALLNVPIHRCIVLEDALSGVRGAVAAGARVVAVPSTVAPPAPEALRTMRELATWLVEDLDQAGVVLFNELATQCGGKGK